MAISRLTLSIQRLVVGLSGLQMAYFAWSYITGSSRNTFPILEQLFKPEFAAEFTESGSWQSIVPFLGSTYLSIAIISLLALFFRPGRELRLLILGLASVHWVMAIIRVTIAPAELYIDGAATAASSVQALIGALLVVAALLPYPKQSV